MIKSLSVLFVVLGLFGCAKNRDVERVRDGDRQNVLSKNDFYATNARTNERADWFAKITAIDTSDSPAGTVFVGFQSDVQVGYFDFTETQLQFRSKKGKLGGVETENVKNSVLMNWNIDHIDYALDERDGQTINQEIEDNFRVWEDRKHFRINWSEQKSISNTETMFPSTSFAFFSCWAPSNVRRVEKSMKIEKDHIGFDVEVVYSRMPACGSAKQWAQSDFNFTATFKYSFRKVQPSDYKAKAFAFEQDEARYKYGHFQTVAQRLNKKNGRPENVFFENRWAEKTHHFYFVKGFPEKYKWIWRHQNPHSVFGQTNALMDSVKSKLKFEIHDYNYNHETGLNDGPEREFGDLRYSFINFIEEIEAGGTPLGYGPSDTNPFTGEIIAANSMVWTGMLGFYTDLMETVGKTVEDKKGNPKQSSLIKQLKSALNVPVETDLSVFLSDWDQTQGVGQVFREMAQETRYGLPFWNSYTSDQAGQLVVPTVVEKYNDGTLTSKNFGKLDYLTEIVSMPTADIPFDFETRVLNGRPQFKFRNPYDVLDVSWLERIANKPGAITGNGLGDFLNILNNLQSLTDSNYDVGNASLSHFTHNHFEKLRAEIDANKNGHCLMKYDEFAGGLAGFLKATKIDFSDPVVRDDFINTVLYRVSIHEFGHNLNLRHNFYGSVDQKNFSFNGPQDSIAKFPGSNLNKSFQVKGKEIVPATSDSIPKTRVQISSSVMDYVRLEDEINTPWAWEDYDVAAILDSYHPDNFNDNGELYLFCTDEHTATSALCNRHDLGTTPSQILMSQIRSYDERYELRNKRFDRAFWNTSGYMSGVFTTMMSMKEFLPLWRSGFAEDLLLEKMGEMGISNPNEQAVYLEQINREMRQVMKLTMAFYQAVVQQSRGDRDYRSDYDETTGALKQIGIISDKIFAMMFLAGDEAIYYNPNRIMLHNSYLTYSREPGLSEFTDRIWRNIVTDRNIAMEPWFINFARFQFAKNATNFNNRGAADLINGMKLVKVNDAQTLFEQYGVEFDLSQSAIRVKLPKSNTGSFAAGDDVVIVNVDSDYYITSVSEGHITYALFQGALDTLTGNGGDDGSNAQFNMDVRELYWLYNLAKSGELQ